MHNITTTEEDHNNFHKFVVYFSNIVHNFFQNL